MTKLIGTLFLLFAGVLGISDSTSSERGVFQIRDQISGTSLGAIQTALPELAKHNLDFRNYRMYVVLDGGELVVVFSDPNKPVGHPGSTTGLQGFEVVLSSDGKAVVSSYFSR